MQELLPSFYRFYTRLNLLINTHQILWDDSESMGNAPTSFFAILQLVSSNECL